MLQPTPHKIQRLFGLLQILLCVALLTPKPLGAWQCENGNFCLRCDITTPDGIGEDCVQTCSCDFALEVPDNCRDCCQYIVWSASELERSKTPLPNVDLASPPLPFSSQIPLSLALPLKAPLLTPDVASHRPNLHSSRAPPA